MSVFTNSFMHRSERFCRCRDDHNCDHKCDHKCDCKHEHKCECTSERKCECKCECKCKCKVDYVCECNHHTNPVSSCHIFPNSNRWYKEYSDVESKDNTGLTSDQANELVTFFIDEYYSKVHNLGWNAILHIYVADAIISCNGNVYTSGPHFLNGMSQGYIKRANYLLHSATWSIIDENTILVTVFGEVQLVSFTGDVSGVGNFSDTFIIRAAPNKTYGVLNHHFYFN